MGTAHPAVKAVRALCDEPLELKSIQAIAQVLETHECFKRYPDGYAALREEVARILATGR